MRKTASGLCLALVCAGLASCSKGGANACSVTPNGKFGSPVTVTVDCPKGAGRLTRETVLEGKGNRIVDGQTVLMRATSFDSRNGEIIKAYNTGELRLAAVTKKGMGDLAKRLVGVREGSRLVIKRPGLVEGVPTASEIIVVDLLFTVAHGKAVPVPNPAPSGMPQVGIADGGGPSIKSPGGAIPSLETVPLVVGNGPQVTEGQDPRRPVRALRPERQERRRDVDQGRAGGPQPQDGHEGPVRGPRRPEDRLQGGRPRSECEGAGNRGPRGGRRHPRGPSRSAGGEGLPLVRGQEGEEGRDGLSRADAVADVLPERRGDALEASGGEDGADEIDADGRQRRRKGPGGETLVLSAPPDTSVSDRLASRTCRNDRAFHGTLGGLEGGAWALPYE